MPGGKLRTGAGGGRTERRGSTRRSSIVAISQATAASNSGPVPLRPALYERATMERTNRAAMGDGPGQFERMTPLGWRASH